MMTLVYVMLLQRRGVETSKVTFRRTDWKQRPWGAGGTGVSE